MKLLGPWPLTRRSEPGKDQAVIVSMRLSNDYFGNETECASLGELEIEIERCLNSARAGEWDGHETGGGYHRIYMYGPCAEKMAEAILPSVLQYAALPGSYLVKRFGEIGSDEQYIWLVGDHRA